MSDVTRNVKIHSLEGNFFADEDITIVFTVKQPLLTGDWIGIFEKNSEEALVRHEFLDIEIDVKDDELPLTNSVKLCVPSPVSGPFIQCQVRYVDEARNTMASSNVFNVTSNTSTENQNLSLSQDNFSQHSYVALSDQNYSSCESNFEIVDAINSAVAITSSENVTITEKTPSIDAEDCLSLDNIILTQEDQISTAPDLNDVSEDDSENDPQPIHDFSFGAVDDMLSQDLLSQDDLTNEVDYSPGDNCKKIENDDDISNLSDAEVRQKLLSEIKKRKIADKNLEELSLQAGKQMKSLAQAAENSWQKDMDHARVGCLNESLNSDLEASEEQREKLENAFLQREQNYLLSYKECREKHQDDIARYEERIDSLNEKIMKYDDSISSLQLQFTNEERDFASYRTLKENEINSMKSKMLDDEKDFEERENDLMKELQDLHNKLKQERQKNEETNREFQELESRLANDSSRASKLENDLNVAEARLRRAEDGGFHLEVKYKEAQQQVSEADVTITKLRNQLNNLRNLQQDSRCATTQSSTESMSKSTMTELNESVVSATSTDFFNIEHSATQTTLSPRDSATSTESESLAPSRSWSDEMDGVAPIVMADIKQVSLDKQSADLFRLGKKGTWKNPDQQQEPAKMTRGNNQRQQFIAVGPQRISVVTNPRGSPLKSRPGVGNGVGMTAAAVAAGQTIHDFNADVSTIDRPVLEAQYSAIRLHRNSLIRENSFLKNKLKGTNTESTVLRAMLQNLILEAEYRLGSMQTELNAARNGTKLECPEEECVVDAASFDDVVGNFASTPFQLPRPDLVNLELMRTEKLMRESEVPDPLSPFACEYVPSVCTPQLPAMAPNLDGSFLAMDGSQFVTSTAAPPPDYYSLIAPPPQPYNQEAAFYYSMQGYPQVQFMQTASQITQQQLLSYLPGQQIQQPPASYVTMPPQPQLCPPVTSAAAPLPTVLEIEA